MAYDENISQYSVVGAGAERNFNCQEPEPKGISIDRSRSRKEFQLTGAGAERDFNSQKPEPTEKGSALELGSARQHLAHFLFLTISLTLPNIEVRGGGI